MRSQSYIYIFVGIMTAVVALVLALMSTALKPIHQRNESIFNKKAILAAIQTELGENVKADKLSSDEVLRIFDESIEQNVIDSQGNILSTEEVESRGYKGGLAENVDMAKERKKPLNNRIYPVYVFNRGGEKIYVVSVRGSGLWDEIWGNIALADDLATVVGASFDHKGETPGLGAEIKDNPSFSRQFAGKMIKNEKREYTSILVRKGGARHPLHEVDGISGATVTADGVSDMLNAGLRAYLPYFDKLKS